jgi:arsenate reductase-like glutaredoxin family protein
VKQPDYILASKVKFQRDEALDIARQAREVVANKGRKLVRVTTADASDDELASIILGRSGTLRAPAIRVGDTLLVGFHAEGYEKVF